VSSTPLHNASLKASYLKERRVNIVVRLLAEGLAVVLLMAFGWWAMTTLGSDSLQPMRDAIYVAGCPLADTTLEKRSAGGSCFREGASHPISSRQPRGGLVEHAHGDPKGTGRVKPLRELLRISLPRTRVNKDKKERSRLL